jgi:hypothetical protein
VDHVVEPIWVVQSYCSYDFLIDTLPLDESILEAMSIPDRTWDNMHRRSYFLSELVRIENDEFRSTQSEMVSHTMVPLYTHGVYAEGKMEKNYPILAIEISQTPGKIENIYIGADCSPGEIHIYIDIFNGFRDVFSWS